MPIVPNSLEIFIRNKAISTNLIRINNATSTIYCRNCPKDSLRISYRTFPLVKSYQYNTKSVTQTAISTASIPRFEYNYDEKNIQNIDVNGSFIRGITVGNRQNAAINSGFNLNVKGVLSNGIEVNAAMNDENIPIQPEGNSASLQEFDNIYIKLKKDQHILTLGDLDISHRTQNHFLTYNRKLAGLDYKSTIPIKKKYSLDLGASAAVTRGTFSRNFFTSRENDQGPYKLTGNNGQTFIIIIAGTERVFINGILMKRGEDNDYIMNYNTGELIFTPHRLITNDLRIVVEFQYSDQSYFRYSIQNLVEFRSKKLNLYSQLYLENDLKNQSINQKLDTSDYRLMSEIGNDISKAVINSGSETKWSESQILYLKKDTIVGKVTYNDIYEKADSSSYPLYRVTFSLLGDKKGDYILSSTGANGSVYQWVAPINGISQGSYMPIRKLTVPISHLQYVIGMSEKWNKSNTTQVEVSYTRSDPNTVSTIDNDKNNGVGVLVKHDVEKKIDETKTVKFGLSEEYTSQHFTTIGRFRNTEFQRDWNAYIPIFNIAEQSLSNLYAGYNSKTIQTNLNSQYFYIPNQYNGLNTEFDFNVRTKPFDLTSSTRVLYAKSTDSTITFIRPKIDMTYKLNSWFIGASLYDEANKVSIDTIKYIANSFLWQNYTGYIGYNKGKHDFKFNYIYRTEQNGDTSTWSNVHTRSHTFQLNGNSIFSKTQRLKYTATYRYFNSTYHVEKIKNNYLGNIEYLGHFIKSAIKNNTKIELKAGREQKLQLTYVTAPNGYGNYAWKDLNENGTLELNEVYISPLKTENTYTKYYISLPEYVPTHQLSLSEYIWLNPYNLWKNEKGILNFLSKLDYIFRVDLDRKERADDSFHFIDYINPFSKISNSSIVYSRVNMYQQLAFQKNRKKVGLDLEWLILNSKNIYSNGLEGIASNTLKFNTRFELFRFLTYKSTLGHGINENQSEYFAERNYKYVSNQWLNQLSFLITSNVKLNLDGDYTFMSTGDIFSVQQRGAMALILSSKNNGLIEANFSVLNLGYEAKIPNQQVELSMLNGIQKGTNFIWGLTVGQKITKFLQINLIYNGRKNTNSDFAIHSGNVEARALF